MCPAVEESSVKWKGGSGMAGERVLREEEEGTDAAWDK